MTVDEFGVPDSLFGPVPEDEYRLVGRLVTVAALVEVNLYDLVTELEQVPQTRYAGEQAATLLKQIATVVGSGTFREDYVSRVQPVLVRARAAFELRNAIVHGVRPVQQFGTSVAWRPVRLKQRVEPGTAIVALPVTLADLLALVLELVDLQATVTDLRVRSYGSRRPLA